jgi:hypothetical protein
MRNSGRLLWLAAGVLLGGAGTALCLGPTRLPPLQPAAHAGNDRFEDYIICTGSVGITPRAPTDGVWLLDYRSGKLLGTVIDRSAGKIVGWGEADLVTQFGIKPHQNVHFMMTTGNIAQGQAALYVAETTTGKFAVYTMGPRLDGQPGAAIFLHDMSTFRQPPKEN